MMILMMMMLFMLMLIILLLLLLTTVPQVLITELVWGKGELPGESPPVQAVLKYR